MNKPRFDPQAAKFAVGEIVRHLKFGYRGVVFDVDPVFSLTDEWYDSVARSRPPRDAPWYHVLVDGASHVTYVAERHLEADPAGGAVSHPQIEHCFSHFDGTRYQRGAAH